MNHEKFSHKYNSSNKTSTTKVAFLNPNIPPRVISLLNKINSPDNISIFGIFFAVAQKNRKWKLDSKEYENINFPYTILKSISLGFGIKDYHNTYLSPGLFKSLRKINPDIIVIPGWADITSFLALVWGKFYGKKVILRTESTASEKSWRRTLFLPVTKLAIIFSDLVIGSSKAAEDYSTSIYFKTPHTHILSSLDTVAFAKKVNKNKKSKAKLKKSLNIPQEYCVYFNGQLLERKGVNELLEAFTSSKLSKVGLLISGYGKLEKQVRAFSSKYSNIHYLGYATQDQLPSYYAIANIFILPSFEETWGLVVIEGLAAGLPIITSQFVGSSEIISKKMGVVLRKITPSSIRRAVTNMLSTAMIERGRYNQQYATNQLNYDLTAKKFTSVFKKLLGLQK